MERPSETESAGSHIDDRAAVVAILLIQGELLAVLDTIKEVNLARLRIRKLVDDVHDIRDSTFEALVNLSVRSLEIRNLTRALKALALEDDLATIGIGVGDAPPDSDSVGMLHGRIDFDLDRQVVVLAKEILDRVDVVLTHVAETA